MTSSAESPAKLLARYGLRPKKSFGQNFLADVALAHKLAGMACPDCDGTVVEVGAGTGALTSALLERAERVIAIERDRDLLPLLRDCFAKQVAEGRLTLVEDDAKTVDLLALVRDEPGPVRLAGNLPYQLTGVLLERFTKVASRFSSTSVLVQLEVASRLIARPGTPAWGALSVFIQAQFVPERVAAVKRGSFYPVPGVDSAFVRLTPRASRVPETQAFARLVKLAFMQRRKTLRNAWSKLEGVSPAQLEAAAQRADINLAHRGEVLDVSCFAKMAQELGQ